MTHSPDKQPRTVSELSRAIGPSEIPLPEFSAGAVLADFERAYKEGAVTPSLELESDGFGAAVIDLARRAIAGTQHPTV